MQSTKTNCSVTCGTETCTICSQHLPEIARAKLTSLPPLRSLTKSESLAQQQDIKSAPQQLVELGLHDLLTTPFIKLRTMNRSDTSKLSISYRGTGTATKQIYTKNCSSRTKLATPKFSENRMPQHRHGMLGAPCENCSAICGKGDFNDPFTNSLNT